MIVLTLAHPVLSLQPDFMMTLLMVWQGPGYVLLRKLEQVRAVPI